MCLLRCLLDRVFSRFSVILYANKWMNIMTFIWFQHQLTLFRSQSVLQIRWLLSCHVSVFFIIQSDKHKLKESRNRSKTNPTCNQTSSQWRQSCSSARPVWLSECVAESRQSISVMSLDYWWRKRILQLKVFQKKKSFHSGSPIFNFNFLLKIPETSNCTLVQSRDE